MVDIETAQHVQLSYHPAGAGERVLAFFLDAFFIGIYYLVVLWLWGSVTDILSNPSQVEQTSTWVLYIVLVLPVMMYHLIFEIVWKGYSPGKKIVGIRVVKTDGSRATLSGYLLRWMFRLVEIAMSSGVIAFITIIINGKGQRLGDIAGNTCVITEQNKMGLQETLYAKIPPGYEPVFQEAGELQDEDIRVINEVLNARSHYEYGTWYRMLQTTRTKIENRLQVRDDSMRTDEFLKTILKDYTAIHGK